MKNIIDAVTTLVKRENFTLADTQGGNNRMGKWSEIFSYTGNSANPPDLMLKGGDAVEVKKIESPDAAIALNSSYPKHTLKNSSPLISRACREAEDWTEKNIIYAVGVVSGNNLKHSALKVDDVKIKSPDNPAELLNAKLITYSKESV